MSAHRPPPRRRLRRARARRRARGQPGPLGGLLSRLLYVYAGDAQAKAATERSIQAVDARDGEIGQQLAAELQGTKPRRRCSATPSAWSPWASAARTRRAFQEIDGAVEDMAARVEGIAAAVREISAQAARIEGSVNEVASVAEVATASAEEVSATSEQTSASAQEMASSAAEPAATAERLDALVGRFKIAV